MTGMGTDGYESLKLLKNNGATIIAQDESSCVVYGMSKEPIETGIADVIAPLEDLAMEIAKTVKQRAKSLIEIAAPQFREELREQFISIYGRDCYK